MILAGCPLRYLVILHEMFKLKLIPILERFSHRMTQSGRVLTQILSHKPRFLCGPLLNEQNDANSDQSKKPENTASDSKNPRDLPPRQNAPKSDGPPDLDVLWNDFNRRLGDFFGGKKGGNSKPTNGHDNSNTNPSGNSQDQQFGQSGQSGPTEPPPKNRPDTQPNLGGGISGQLKFKLPKVGFGVLLAVFAAIWMSSGFFIVQEGEAGVVLQFGKYKYTARPGINWRLPSPIQSHEIVNLSGVRSVVIGRPVMIQATNLKDASMLTEDENIIDVKFAVQYRLKDPMDYLFMNREPDEAVVQAAETAVREIVGHSKMDTVLYEGREKIAIDLSASIQKILDSYKSGILITSVTVQNVQPPEQVQASFDDAVKAGQDQERLKNEGLAYANDIIPRAKGTAARLKEESEGYKARVIATAEGDASRFKQIYVEYAKAPQVTRDRMYIDTMQQVYNNVTKVMVDAKSGTQLLYLPLDKLMQQVSAESAASVASSPAAPVAASTQAVMPATQTAPTTPVQVDKRDSLRSRDRDAR